MTDCDVNDPQTDDQAAVIQAECDQREDNEECVETLESEEVAPPRSVVRRGSTFESFRHRDFSWFWTGALVSNTGTWMQTYALGIVVFSLRQSEFDLGLVNFAAGIPVLFLALPGGALADRTDRRRLLIGIQVVLIAQAALLGWLYNAGVISPADARRSLVIVAGLGMLAGIFSALQFPAWQAMLPDLVPRESLLNAIALNSAQFQSTRLIGPLLAGALVLAGAGMGDIFYVNAASFLFVIAALWIIRPNQLRHEAGGAHGRPREGAIKTLLGGVAYARENRAVGVLIVSTAIMTIFGFPYMTLLPAIVDKTLHLAEGTNEYKQAVALIMATNGLGAMIGALGVASLKEVRRHRVIPFSLLGFGLMLLIFSLSRTLWLTSVISAFAGAALMTTNSMTNTSIQSAAPPQLRGRVMGLFVMAFMGIMPISGLLFGILGQGIGPSNAVFVGSVLLIAWSLLLVVRPQWLEPAA